MNERVRAWQGPALFSYGFRPFFLGGAVWAVAAMVLWIAMLTGSVFVPTFLDPVSWHAHEFLFGYLGAVIAGFLLTAVPNWTERPPIVGWRLAGLTALWLAGRIGVASSENLPLIAVAVLDLSFPVVLGVAVAREIVAGRNWRNLIILGLLAVFTLGNAMFYWESAQGDYAPGGVGLRVGLAAAIMMIAVIGGRIVPSFTRNWLVKRGETRLPAPPMQRFDRISLVVLLLALVLWVVLPDRTVSGAGLVLAGLLHISRLLRWKGHLTAREPLVLVLHVAYAFLPIGALAMGMAILSPDVLDMAAAQHLWMGGAVGLMTLAVMTRATLGHTGQRLTAGTGTIGIYLALILAVLCRVAAGILPGEASWLNMLSGLAWIGAFAGYVVFYGKLLIRAAPQKSE